MAKEWIVLGRSAAALGWAETFFASSAVAARVNVRSFSFNLEGRFRESNLSISATRLALLPVPGPARIRP